MKRKNARAENYYYAKNRKDVFEPMQGIFKTKGYSLNP